MTYYDWGYELAGEIIEETSGQAHCPRAADLAELRKSYMAPTDGTFCKVQHPPFESGKLIAPAEAKKFTLSEMLTLYSALIEYEANQSSSDANKALEAHSGLLLCS
ncbi:hypothetical protein BX600DRAFT_442508 [Xylariales sp. PMI_506]|nr:hypothetical protein BX600DRAFT_442508 [Xylariales sp. PMI_506]